MDVWNEYNQEHLGKLQFDLKLCGILKDRGFHGEFQLA